MTLNIICINLYIRASVIELDLERIPWCPHLWINLINSVWHTCHTTFCLSTCLDQNALSCFKLNVLKEKIVGLIVAETSSIQNNIQYILAIPFSSLVRLYSYWPWPIYTQNVLFCSQGLQTSSYTLAMELFGAHHRSYVGAILEVFWGFGVMTVPLLAYLIPNWRYLQLAITLPSIVALAYFL